MRGTNCNSSDDSGNFNVSVCFNCFPHNGIECSFLYGGGALLIVIIIVICITLCLCLLRRRRRKRSRDISETTAGKPAQNDYKIENLTNDDTESYSNGSGATGSGQGNYHMKDLSVRTPKSLGSSETKGSSDMKSNPLDSIPENDSETKHHNSAPQGHKYDDVLPSDVSNSIDTPSKTMKLEPYSEARTHTLVLSNTDSRGSSKPGHTYHLLDGSSADEKATFIEASVTYSNTTGKDTFLRGNLASENVMLGQSNENGQSRRTTLSGIPSKSGVFDDPTYANTATTFAAAGKPPLNKASLSSNNWPQRSSSLTQNTGKKNKNNIALSHSKAKNKPSEQPLAVVFDDPAYDVGLNLANT